MAFSLPQLHIPQYDPLAQGQDCHNRNGGVLHHPGDPRYFTSPVAYQQPAGFLLPNPPSMSPVQGHIWDTAVPHLAMSSPHLDARPLRAATGPVPGTTPPRHQSSLSFSTASSSSAPYRYNPYAPNFVPPHQVSVTLTAGGRGAAFQSKLGPATTPSFVPPSFREPKLRSPSMRSPTMASPTLSKFGMLKEKESKKSKMMVRVPRESRDEGNAIAGETEQKDPRRLSLITRDPLPEKVRRRRLTEMDQPCPGLEHSSREPHPDEVRQPGLPPTVDIYLPGQSSWDDMRIQEVEDNLQQMRFSTSAFSSTDPRMPGTHTVQFNSPSPLESMPSGVSASDTDSQVHRRGFSTNFLPPRFQHAFGTRKHASSQSVMISGTLPLTQSHSFPSPHSPLGAALLPSPSPSPSPQIAEQTSLPTPLQRLTLDELARGFGFDVIQNEENFDVDASDTDVADEESPTNAPRFPSLFPGSGLPDSLTSTPSPITSERSSWKELRLHEPLSVGRRTPDAFAPSGDNTSPSPGRDNIRAFKFPSDTPPSAFKGLVAQSGVAKPDQLASPRQHSDLVYQDSAHEDVLSPDGCVRGVGPLAGPPLIAEFGSRGGEDSLDDIAIPSATRPRSRAIAVSQADPQKRVWSRSCDRDPSDRSTVSDEDGDLSEGAFDDVVTASRNGEDSFENPLAILEEILVREFDKLREEVSAFTEVKAEVDALKSEALVDSLSGRIDGILSRAFGAGQEDVIISIGLSRDRLEQMIHGQMGQINASLASIVESFQEQTKTKEDNTILRAQLADHQIMLAKAKAESEQAQSGNLTLVDRLESNQQVLITKVEKLELKSQGHSETALLSELEAFGQQTSERLQDELAAIRSRIQDLGHGMSSAWDRQEAWHATELQYLARLGEQQVRAQSLEVEAATLREGLARLRLDLVDVRQENSALMAKLTQESEASAEARGEVAALEKRLAAQEKESAMLQQISFIQQQNVESANLRATECENRAIEFADSRTTLTGLLAKNNTNPDALSNANSDHVLSRKKMEQALEATNETAQGERQELALVAQENELPWIITNELENKRAVASVAAASRTSTTDGHRQPLVPISRSGATPPLKHSNLSLHSEEYPSLPTTRASRSHCGDGHPANLYDTVRPSSPSSRVSWASRAPVKAADGWWE